MAMARIQGERKLSPTLPQIPFDFGDLEPAMSRDTLMLHFSRHHVDHFERTVALARSAALDHLGLAELVTLAAHSRRLHTLYRHAAETWNHGCFWNSLRPDGGGRPVGAVAQAIDARFGTYERFVRRFQGVAATIFGNGWLWLTSKDDSLRIVATAPGDTPMVRGHTVLLALDLWEHAYYLDHVNRRGAYIRSFLDELVNWQFAERELLALSTAQDHALPVPSHLAAMSSADAVLERAP